MIEWRARSNVYVCSKDFISAKVLMQSSTRMSKRVPGDKVQYIQDFIKKHDVWKNPKFWEEYFWGKKETIIWMTIMIIRRGIGEKA